MWILTFKYYSEHQLQNQIICRLEKKSKPFESSELVFSVFLCKLTGMGETEHVS